ncbi:MAG TPA: chemotaxis protein CheA [Paenalcaligenes sp.]|nr:chemotaxis protein CheA [Paenalcaligenes sp.]
MSSGLDLSQFFDTFFDEADELLTEMEGLLLALDVDAPDADDLNAIFRAAHSIKGGAATFGTFEELAETTHVLENVLDDIRNGELPLRADMIDLFLTTKDVLSDMVSAYRQSEPLDPDVSLSLRENLVNLKKEPASSAQNRPSITQSEHLKIHIESIRPQDATALRSEMAIMGEVLHEEAKDDSITFWLDTSTAVDDIIAVSCFVVNEEQITTAYASLPGPAQENQTKSEIAQPNRTKTQTGSARRSESSTLRVGVKRVDQIINLVGELVITQAMLVQTAEDLDPVVHDRLLNGLEQLERNARDLQEAVMAIRMVPMDYVFNRFPRVVRENAQRLGKNIRLVTKGQATELDKSLIERIIDPLTHLVRNCIDHGLEMPEQRLSVGKEAEGVLTLSAQHQGGHIIIEVIDDGAGLNREKILQKAMQQGLVSNENISDEELWQLLFAPGFSTAEKVTEISGRGVGMDVVRRNIQGMGGHVYVTSQKGQGTTTRIVLPLTLAILDGMSVKVGDEVFILPLSHVMESMQPEVSQLRRMTGGEHVLYVRGEYLPVVSLGDVFAVTAHEENPTQAIAVVLQAEDTRFALLVDQLLGQHQVVVKNLETNYKKIPGISAATILGDGSVALIVDVFALHRMNRDRVGGFYTERLMQSEAN